MDYHTRLWLSKIIPGFYGREAYGGVWKWTGKYDVSAPTQQNCHEKNISCSELRRHPAQPEYFPQKAFYHIRPILFQPLQITGFCGYNTIRNWSLPTFQIPGIDIQKEEEGLASSSVQRRCPADIIKHLSKQPEPVITSGFQHSPPKTNSVVHLKIGAVPSLIGFQIFSGRRGVSWSAALAPVSVFPEASANALSPSGNVIAACHPLAVDGIVSSRCAPILRCLMPRHEPLNLACKPLLVFRPSDGKKLWSGPGPRFVCGEQLPRRMEILLWAGCVIVPSSAFLDAVLSALEALALTAGR